MIYFSIEDVFLSKSKYLLSANDYMYVENISQICLNGGNFNFDEQIYLTYLSNENYVV